MTITISAVINSLEAIRKQQGDIPVVIEDADTNWLLAVQTVRLLDGYAVIAGEYHSPENPERSQQR